MSEAKHTKGPWRIGAMESGRYAVDGENGQEVTGWLDSEADARLIAAAPELLEALQALVNEPQPIGIDRTAYQAALVAIAKATGGAA